MSIRFSLTALCAASLVAALPVRAINVSSSAAVSSGFADSSGNALPYADLILIGTFSIDNATIAANASNLSFLLSHFIQIGSSYIGQGNPTGSGESAHDNYGLFAFSTSVNINTTAYAGSQLYHWVFNSTATTTATEQGIFSSTVWIIPSGDGTATDTAYMVTDISNLNADSVTGTGLAPTAQIVVGSFGLGTNPTGGGEQFNLASIASPVPEPATYAALFGAGALVFALWRRRRSSPASR